METQKAYEKMREYLSSRIGKQLAVEHYGGSGSSCLYRLRHEGETIKCAAGALIPDELYDSGMENMPIDNLMDWDDRMTDLFMGCNINFLSEAQTLHDQYARDFNVGDPDLIEQLDRLAIREGLEVPVGQR